MSAGAPWFVLVAGINGAGKSTCAQNPATLRVLLEAQGPEIAVITPDLITGEILRSELLLPLSTDDAAFDAKSGGWGRGFGAGPRAIVAQCTPSIHCWA